MQLRAFLLILGLLLIHMTTEASTKLGQCNTLFGIDSFVICSRANFAKIEQDTGLRMRTCWNMNRKKISTGFEICARSNMKDVSDRLRIKLSSCIRIDDDIYAVCMGSNFKKIEKALK